MICIYIMLVPHIESVDLNLLTPLAALLEERHVSRAAQRAGLSQPAMSRALQRLRETLDDELLVRGAAGYQLTPRAERIRRRLTMALPQLEILFAEETFDPATAAETFRMTGTDYSASVWGPSLYQQVFRQSPNSRLEFRAWHSRVFDDVERSLTDLAFCAGGPPAPLRSEHLPADRFVCVMSADHPLADRTRLTLAEYLTCQHVEIQVVDGGQTLIERKIPAARKISLSVAYHASAPLAVPGTRLVATLPRRLVAQYGDDPQRRIVAAPTEIEHLPYLMVWHPRLDDDPAHRWLRDIVRQQVKSGDQAVTPIG